MSNSLRTSMMRLSSQLILMHAMQNSHARLDAREAQAHALKDISLDETPKEETDNRPVVLVTGREPMHLAIADRLRHEARVIVVDESTLMPFARGLAADDLDRTISLRVNPAEFDLAVKSLESARSCMGRAERRGGPAQWKQRSRNGR